VQLIKDWFKRYFNDPQVVVLALLLLAGFIVTVLLGEILLPVLASVVIAYLLEGVVALLQRRGLPRFPAVMVVFFVFLALFVLILFGLVPLLYGQLTRAIEELPNMIRAIYDALSELPERYAFIDKEEFRTNLKQIWDSISTQLRVSTPALGGQIITISLASFRGLVVTFVYLILMPILVFFMLKDKDRLLAWLNRFVPKERGLATRVWYDVDRQLANYVRGKFGEIIIVGSATFATFMLLDVQYTVLLSMLVGLSVIVPYIGATVVTFPVAIVAYAQWGFGSEFVWVVTAYLVIQALDGNVLVPLIFSEAVHLHPIAIITAVLVFGGMWGFWGAFFAIPLATLVQAILNAWPRHRPDPVPP